MLRSDQLRESQLELLQVLCNFPQVENQGPERQHAVKGKGRGCPLGAEFGQVEVEVANGIIESRCSAEASRQAATAIFDSWCVPLSSK
jgi:hypothetical protein